MAIAVLENPVLFGMRLGAELDQLRQGAMTQAISQSLREALDLHTWRYGMIANLLAAYHRAQSPEEKGAYAKFIDALVQSATYPPANEQNTVVPGVAVSVPYLQEQQGDSARSNQQQPEEQQATAPQTSATAQPAAERQPTPEELRALLEALALVNPWYGLVHHRLQSALPQTTMPKQQTEDAVQPIQQQPVEQQGAEQIIPEEQLPVAPVQQVETAPQPVVQQPAEQQTQGTLGGILQQQPNQQQPTMPAQPSQQQPGEYKYAEQTIPSYNFASTQQTLSNKVLPLVFLWYPFLKDAPKLRDALSGLVVLDLDATSQEGTGQPKFTVTDQPTIGFPWHPLLQYNPRAQEALSGILRVYSEGKPANQQKRKQQPVQPLP